MLSNKLLRTKDSAHLRKEPGGVCRTNLLKRRMDVDCLNIYRSSELVSPVWARCSLSPVGSRKLPFYMQYRSLQIGAGPGSHMNLRLFSFCPPPLIVGFLCIFLFSIHYLALFSFFITLLRFCCLCLHHQLTFFWFLFHQITLDGFLLKNRYRSRLQPLPSKNQLLLRDKIWIVGAERFS